MLDRGRPYRIATKYTNITKFTVQKQLKTYLDKAVVQGKAAIRKHLVFSYSYCHLACVAKL